MPILHRTRTVSALMPRYVERFRCTGSSCKDTCCASWSIHIDKKTYDAYRQSALLNVEPDFADEIVSEDGTRRDAIYAAIRLEGEEKKCPLMEDGFCSVHKKAGESYLSDTCFTYPRISRRFDGQVEHVLDLSCPEAARQALLAEDAFDFIEGKVAVREHTVFHAGQGAPVALMNEVRIFCLNLLRTRELRLWQRLALLGTLCAAISGLCVEEKQAQIPAFLADFASVVESGALLADLETIVANHAGQAMVFSTLWSFKGFESPSPHQQALIRQISLGLGAGPDGQASAVTLVDAYVRGLSRLDEALQETPYLLENYLINEMFMRLFPFEASDVYDSYLRLVARFGLLRLLLVAQCNTDTMPSASTLVATTHLHCRRFQHNKAYTELVNSALRESGWSGLDKLHSLIKF